MNRRTFLSLLPSIPLVPRLLGEDQVGSWMRIFNSKEYKLAKEEASFQHSLHMGKLWLDKNWNEITKDMKFYRPNYE